MVGEVHMDQRPFNSPRWRENANLLEGSGLRLSMRRVLELQEPYRRWTAERNWGSVMPDYTTANQGLYAFMGNTRIYGAVGLLEWWQYWALRRIRTAVSQFVRRRNPRVARNYEDKSIIKRFRNYVPGAANVGTTLGKRRRLD